MFKKILVPTDGAALSYTAIASAIEFAKLHGGKIVAISVAKPYPYSQVEEGSSAIAMNAQAFNEAAQKVAEKHVENVASLARTENVECITRTALSDSPYEEIVHAATDLFCDVIFMASHGRKGLHKLFVGSETQKVLAHTNIPVLVFR